jgi:hypothetical protein
MSRGGPYVRIRQADYDALEDKDPNTLYRIDESAEPYPPTSTDAATRDYERLVAGGMHPQQAAANARAALHQRTLREQETMPNPDTERAEAEARYHSTLHTEPARTIRLDPAGLDAGIYVELLRLITDRWPRAKMANGGIVVPDEKDPVAHAELHFDLPAGRRSPGPDDKPTSVTMTIPVPATKASADHRPSSPQRDQALGAFAAAGGKLSAMGLDELRLRSEQLFNDNAEDATFPVAPILRAVVELTERRRDDRTREDRVANRSWWAAPEQTNLVAALSNATGHERSTVLDKLAYFGSLHHTATNAIAAFVADQELVRE